MKELLTFQIRLDWSLKDRLPIVHIVRSVGTDRSGLVEGYFFSTGGLIIAGMLWPSGTNFIDTEFTQ